MVGDSLRRDDEAADPKVPSRERVTVFKGLEGIDELGPGWEALADQVAAPPWWRPGWVRAWWRAFGRGRLQVIALQRNDRWVGIVPMERRGFGELRSTTNYHTPSFGLLAADEDARRSLAKALIPAAPRQLTVSFLPSVEPSLGALESASKAARRLQLVRVLERCPYIVIQGTWSDLLATRPSRLTRGIHRRRRKLAALGRVELDVHDGRQDLDRLLEEGFAVEAAGWKGERGTAIASNPATRGFYTEIAHWLAARQSLRLSFLRLDGRPLAFDFAVEEGGRHSLLKTGYDATFRAEAPGVLLRASVIEQAFQSQLRRYDFLGKDDPWKREWTSTVEEQVRFESFGRSPAGVASWAAQRYLRLLVRRVLRRG